MMRHSILEEVGQIIEIAMNAVSFVGIQKVLAEVVGCEGGDARRCVVQLVSAGTALVSRGGLKLDMKPQGRAV